MTSERGRGGLCGRGIGHRLIRAIMAAAGLLACAGAAAADISGRWIGTYSCAGMQPASLVLEFEPHDERGMIEGLFAFQTDQGSGSYRVSGRLGPDGRLVLVPRDWVERPPGFTALGVEAALTANGRRFEGKVGPCLMGALSVARDEPLRPIATTEVAPLSGGAFAGLWRGNVECRANRRGKTELQPLVLALWQDGEGVGGIATLRVWRKFGSGGGEYWDQTLLLSGWVEEGRLALGQHVVLDAGGAPNPLRTLTGEIGADGTLAGEAKLRGCESFSVVREAPAVASPWIAGAEGFWTGFGDRQGDTLLTLHAVPDAQPPFWFLEAAYPVSRPDSARDRLGLVLMPVVEQEGVTVLVPVNAREGSGVFDPRSRSSVHVLVRAGAFAIRLAGDGALHLRHMGSREAEYRLERPAAGVAEAMGAGEMPPLDLGPGIAGTLAAAPSREAQCRVLDAWLGPYTAGRDMNRMVIDQGHLLIADAFEDAVFEPVFGLPFLFTTEQERRALARLILETCNRQMGMAHLGFVANTILPESYFRRVAARLTDRAETAGWRAELEAELAALGVDEAGLARLGVLRGELRGRQRDMTHAEQTELAALIDRREAELRAGALLAEAEALPETGFGEGALDQVLGFTRRALGSGLDGALLMPALRVAESRARAILAPVLREEGEAAAGAPQTLEGLASVMGRWNRLAGARAGMEQYFGSFDPDGHLAGLEARLRALWADPAVMAAFREHLLGLETGPIPEPVLRNEAARHVDLDRLHLAPGWGEILSEALSRAELRAVRVELLAAALPEGAPKVEEIAIFVLERVRGANAGQARQEEHCSKGQFANPIDALGCLPALTGQSVRSRLHAVRVIGCETEVAMQQYLCTFTQEITMEMPAGSALGDDWLSQVTGNLTSNEAVDARFVRAAGGGWSVVWGDLR